jgi:gliding motility-associated-like protein
LCAGEEVTLTASNGSTYNWDNGVVNGQSFIPSVTTTYTVTGTDAEGCTNTDQVTVVLVTPPTSSFFADSLTGYPGLSVEFTNTSTDATDYFWLFGNGFSTTSTDLSGQSMVYDQPGTYGVYLIADNGYCQDSSTLQIVVIPFPDPVLHIPNVFTPNGDASNDLFFIETAYVSELELTIINRWGNFVAEILDVNGNWDGKISGKDADEGVYFYKYRAKGVNGKELTGHGNITLLR